MSMKYIQASKQYNNHLVDHHISVAVAHLVLPRVLVDAAQHRLLLTLKATLHPDAERNRVRGVGVVQIARALERFKKSLY